MGDIKDLQLKSDAGKLIILNGSQTGTGTAVSYTPPNGNTFVLAYADVDILQSTSGNRATAQLRNNGTVRDTKSMQLVTSGEGIVLKKFLISGDTLVGDGVKTYDVNISANPGTNPIFATIEGYLE